MADIKNVTVNSGSLVITASFPLYRSGATIVLSGFVLDDQAIDSNPLIDQSARVALVNGGSIVNVNSNRAGVGTLRAYYDDSYNNAWKIASEIAYSDTMNMQSGIITVSMEYNGETRTVQYTDVVWQNVPIFSINPSSPSAVDLTFSFGDHSTIGEEVLA